MEKNKNTDNTCDSPLSSKVAMFNNQANQHKQSQLLNPFSNSDGRVSPKPQFSKDEYGKPLAGSLTEMRGQKANIHVMKEMLELCQIIDSEGYTVKDEPKMRVIPFGELFNIYNYISDKVVGILLRARKHKLVEFEGEMLFQRRDDDVPVFLLMPIAEIRAQLEAKMAEIKRASSPAPQATSVLLDKSAHAKKLRDHELGLPKSGRLRSRTPSPSPAGSTAVSQAATPAGSAVPSRAATPPTSAVLPEFTDKLTAPKLEAAVVKAIKPEPIKPEPVTPAITVDAPPKGAEPAAVEASSQAIANTAVTAVTEPTMPTDLVNTPAKSDESVVTVKEAPMATDTTATAETAEKEPTVTEKSSATVNITEPAPTVAEPIAAPTTTVTATDPTTAVIEQATTTTTPPAQENLTSTTTPESTASPSAEEKKIDANNNKNNSSIQETNEPHDDVPLTEVIEATAVYVRSVSIDASKDVPIATETTPAADVAPTSPNGENQKV